MKQLWCVQSVVHEDEALIWIRTDDDYDPTIQPCCVGCAYSSKFLVYGRCCSPAVTQQTENMNDPKLLFSTPKDGAEITCAFRKAKEWEPVTDWLFEEDRV